MSLDNTKPTPETHFDYASRLRDLDEAVLLARQAFQIHHPPDPLHCESLDNLAEALSSRFEEGGQRSDLNEAISLHQEALELRLSPDSLRPNSLNNLSKMLLLRYLEEGQPSNLDEAISLSKQVFELLSPTHPLQSSCIYNHAGALHARFWEGGRKSDLSDAISMYQQVLELHAPPHPLRSDSIDRLGSALRFRFVYGGEQTDLERAISLHRQALKLRPSPHPQRSMSLSNLAAALTIQFEHEGHRRDLDDSILLHKQALELRPSPHPLRSWSLNNLAYALWARFGQEGHQSDLNEAILLHRQALELRPSPNPFRAASIANLATTLHRRFQQGGNQNDLDEAISLHRQALELKASSDLLRDLPISNLANALLARFEQGGHQSDLDEAISLNRQALELRPSPHRLRSISLHSLASSLSIRFEEEGRQSDLDEAILLLRQALELLPSPHPLRSLSLNDLAIVLRMRFEKTGHEINLNEAISLSRDALDLESLSHPSRSFYLNSLANALLARFGQESHQIDLNEAILMHKQAVELQLSHPRESNRLHDLGKALIVMHAHSLTGNNSNYLEEAMKVFYAATQCLNQAASIRLHITHTWIKHAVLHQHVSAIDAYDVALQTLPKLAALSFDIKSRQKALLVDSDGLARDASRFAIRAGKVDKAIEFLEAGRAVFWSQFLSLRSPLEQLREIAPELADKLRDTATALELGSHRNTLADASANQQKLVLDQETARLNRLNEEWSKVIEDVRQLTGFEDFLRPRSFSELQVAASEGPVVVLIGNDDGSDILILTSVDVQNIPLPGLATKELQNLVHLIQAASSASKIWLSHFQDRSGNTSEFPQAIVETLRNWIKLEEERGMRYQGQVQIDSDDVFRYVLNTLWSEVVKPVIDILNIEKSEEPPVVHWCPTGLFSFLPIHAAGCYNNHAVQCASDYFISSYTPTIEALLTQNRAPSAESFKMMVVIQSQELEATRKELENIEKHVSNDFLVKLGIPGVSASVEAVSSQLSNVNIVHFSCHGTQDRLNPLDSGLKLEDGSLRISRIMKEKIQNGALAFLCACETAMGDGKLPDEAMSLGASLLFLGFRRVVATMWAMQDKDGPVVADAFYKELFRGPDGKPTREPDARKSAYALHMAIKRLRAEKASFSRWVPFIHMGK